MSSTVDGYFEDDKIVYFGPKDRLFVGQGFRIEAPELENAGIAGLNSLEDEIRVLLRNLKPEVRYQIRWDSDNDYRQALLEYQEITERGEMSDWGRTARSERFVRYWRRMEEGELRRERLHLFVTMPLAGKAGIGSSRRKFYEALLKSSETGFRQFQQLFDQVFGRLGGKVAALDELAHFEECLRHFNPSANQQGDVEPRHDPLRSIREQCVNGDARFLEKPQLGFYLDGLYHGMIVLKSLPQTTCSGMIRHLTGLPMLDYSIIVNVQGLEVDKEIQSEESKLAKLQNALAHSGRARMSAAIEKKLKKIQRLMSNDVRPCKMQMMVRAWAKTPEDLQAKLAALKSAIIKMQGAGYYEPAFPATYRNYLFASLPGWSWDRYQDHALYIDDHNLANLLPISGTPTGKLEGAEALYDGANGNLIGIKSFDGRADNQAPQHGLVSGMSGSGKSMKLIDLLTQTEPYYDFTVIVDNGLSYETYVQKMAPGTRPIVLKPDGGVVFNYLDTQGLPLFASHIADASSLVLLMAGSSADEDKNRLRQASITTALNGLYRDHFEQWSQDNRSRFIKVAKRAMAMQRWQQECGETSADVRERFQAFCEWKAAHGDDFSAWIESISDVEAERFARDPATADQVFRLAFSDMSAEELPTHGQFQEWLLLESMGNHPRKEELSALATLLEPWCAQSESFGSLLDGATNVEFTGNMIHFELGQIPESAPELRAIAGHLITNQIRNEIMRRPRNLRKRVVLEELGAFLSIPGGERIVREFYERMRKYNAWVVSVVQQSSMLGSDALRASVLGNCKMALMLKQSDRSELDRMSEHFQIPDSTKDTIARFPDPGKDRPAGFCYFHHADGDPVIAIGQNIASDTMIDAASSTGDHFEARKAKQLTTAVSKKE